jgi:2-keto-4-pentenoate hydratase/2-oxohepta-3-ene-1,7-dioic acid hydratase in catechol pathway
MKWCTFRSSAEPELDRVGLLSGDDIAALPAGTRLMDLIGQGHHEMRRAGETALESGERFARSAVSLRPPIPNPPSIRDFSSFHEHISVSMRNIGATFNDNWFEAPVFYFTSPNNLFADGELVRIPGDTRQMDYELEIACVIGRGGIDIAPADALDHVAGYTILNDWSARDLQAAEMKRLPIGPGKGKDASTSIGPYLVTSDELEDRASGTGFDLTMTARVNGTEYSRGVWSSLYWSFAEMIAFASRSSPLVPGDIIGAGTVGTGCILEQSGTHGADRYPWLKEGDTVELEIERIGTLTNTVRWNKPPVPLRAS